MDQKKFLMISEQTNQFINFKSATQLEAVKRKLVYLKQGPFDRLLCKTQ